MRRDNLAWFVAGCTLSGIIWLLFASDWAYRPTIQQNWPEQVKKTTGVPAWTKDTTCEKIGHFIFTASSDSVPAEAIVYPDEPGIFPIVHFMDMNKDGRVEAVTVTVNSDNAYFTIEDMDEDGRWDSYSYDKGRAAGIAITDVNMDGQYDYRFGPGEDAFAAMIDGAWREVIDRGNKQFVEIDGKLIEVRRVDRVLTKFESQE